MTLKETKNKINTPPDGSYSGKGDLYTRGWLLRCSRNFIEMWWSLKPANALDHVEFSSFSFKLMIKELNLLASCPL